MDKYLRNLVLFLYIYTYYNTIRQLQRKLYETLNTYFYINLTATEYTVYAFRYSNFHDSRPNLTIHIIIICIYIMCLDGFFVRRVGTQRYTTSRRHTAADRLYNLVNNKLRGAFVWRGSSFKSSLRTLCASVNEKAFSSAQRSF